MEGSKAGKRLRSVWFFGVFVRAMHFLVFAGLVLAFIGTAGRYFDSGYVPLSERLLV
jgi:hypothetical protein